MDVDLTDLRLFVRTADECNISRAAEHQHLSLAAASARIKSLEAQSGLSLLYREARGVRLTPPGEAFLFHARGVLRQAEQLRADLQEYGGGLRGHRSQQLIFRRLPAGGAARRCGDEFDSERQAQRT